MPLPRPVVVFELDAMLLVTPVPEDVIMWEELDTSPKESLEHLAATAADEPRTTYAFSLRLARELLAREGALDLAVRRVSAAYTGTVVVN